MATPIDTSPRIAWATAVTADLWVAEHAGVFGRTPARGEHALSPGQGMGELEDRLALGALATAQRTIPERLEAVGR